jgi:hypothetical protein
MFALLGQDGADFGDDDGVWQAERLRQGAEKAIDGGELV